MLAEEEFDEEWVGSEEGDEDSCSSREDGEGGDYRQFLASLWEDEAADSDEVEGACPRSLN